MSDKVRTEGVGVKAKNGNFFSPHPSHCPLITNFGCTRLAPDLVLRREAVNSLPMSPTSLCLLTYQFDQKVDLCHCCCLHFVS